MARTTKHWLFELYINLIGNRKSPDDAIGFIRETFPNVTQIELVTILENMGDVAKADDDYANKLNRSKISALKDGNGPRDELASRMFSEAVSDG